MSEAVYTEADLRDLAVARDIADRSIRIRLDLNLGDYDRTIDLDVAHLLAAALARVQYVRGYYDDLINGEMRCADCHEDEGKPHADDCLVGRALDAWMNGSVSS